MFLMDLISSVQSESPDPLLAVKMKGITLFWLRYFEYFAHRLPPTPAAGGKVCATIKTLLSKLQ